MTSTSDPSLPNFSSGSINLEFLPDWARKQPTDHKNFEAHSEPRRPSRPQHGGGKKSSSSRPPRKDDRRDRSRSPHQKSTFQRPAPAPDLPNIQVHFIPEEKALESVIEQIRMTGRAYPLFSLSKMFLDKPERHGVMFRTKSPEKGQPAQPLFQCQLCTAVALGESQAVTHVLSQHRAQFYEEERVATEPPKGNFTSVARCDLNGALLGPSNYHGYQSNVLQLYKAQFRHMSFDRFKESIKSVRDPELVKKWQEQSSHKTTFKCLQVEPPTVLQTESELERHFREHHLAKTIHKASEITMTGEASRGLEDHRVVQLIRTHWEKEDQFPANLANRLRQSFNKVGLHVFKARRGMQFVSPFHPKALVADPVDVSPNVVKILDFIKAHPHADRKKLLEALEQKAPAAADATPPVENASVAQEPSPILNDLHWLIHQGHVIEYHNGHLDAVRPPPPPKETKKKSDGTTDAAATTSETTETEALENDSESASVTESDPSESIESTDTNSSETSPTA